MTRVLLLVAAALVLGGCAVLARATFSAPVATPGEVTLVRRGVSWDGCPRGDVLELADVAIAIRVHDDCRSFALFGIVVPFFPNWGTHSDSTSYAESSGRAPSLLVQLDVVPKTSGVSFEPGRVTLERAGGRTLRPVGYFGPQSALYWKHEPLRNGCRVLSQVDARGHHPDATPLAFGSPAIAVERETCFMLLFATAPPPAGEGFGLAIDAVRAGGERLAVPTLRFERASAWSFALVDTEGQSSGISW